MAITAIIIVIFGMNILFLSLGYYRRGGLALFR